MGTKNVRGLERKLLCSLSREGGGMIAESCLCSLKYEKVQGLFMGPRRKESKHVS